MAVLLVAGKNELKIRAAKLSGYGLGPPGTFPWLQ